MAPDRRMTAIRLINAAGSAANIHAAIRPEACRGGHGKRKKLRLLCTRSTVYSVYNENERKEEKEMKRESAPWVVEEEEDEEEREETQGRRECNSKRE